jgi:hypothetical protein
LDSRPVYLAWIFRNLIPHEDGTLGERCSQLGGNQGNDWYRVARDHAGLYFGYTSALLGIAFEDGFQVTYLGLAFSDTQTAEQNLSDVDNTDTNVERWRSDNIVWLKFPTTG